MECGASPIDTATPQENQRLETRHVDAEKSLKNQHFVRDFLQSLHVRHVIKQVGMSRSATPATQNDMTTCFETFEKDRFCSFPHRHGEATGKPETRDETRGCRKIGISYETSLNFYIFDMLSNRLECHKVPRLPRKTTWQPAWTHSNRRGFPASPIDTAKPQENQRLETRHVGAPKQAFRARLPPIFTVGNMTKGQESFAASPIDTARPQETRDSRRDRWEHQNEHFVRDFLPFSHFVASKSTFSYEFS